MEERKEGRREEEREEGRGKRMERGIEEEREGEDNSGQISNIRNKLKKN